MASYEEFSDPAFSSRFNEERLHHSWRPAAPSEDHHPNHIDDVADDGVHLPRDSAGEVIVGSEADAPEPVAFSQPADHRGPAAGMVIAVCLAVALVALFIFVPGQLFTVYVAAPLALLAAGLAYYVRRASRPGAEMRGEFERQM